MYNIGKKAGLDDEILIRTIICNLTCKEISMIKIIIKKDCSMKEFLDVIENIGIEEEVIPSCEQKNKNETISDSRMKDIICKLDNLTLQYKKI